MATSSSKQKTGPQAMAKNTPNSFKAIKTVLIVLFIVAASIAGTMFYQNQMNMNSANANTPNEEQLVLPNPVFSPLEPFTVTLNDSSGGRVLYVAITLRVNNQNSHKIIQEYMPEVRDRVLRELATQHPDEVQTATGREALVRSLTQVLQQPYMPHLTGPQISSVLFTAFVVQ